MLSIHDRVLWDLAQTIAGFAESLPVPLNVLAMEDAPMGSAGDQQPNASITVTPRIRISPYAAFRIHSNAIFTMAFLMG